MLTVTDNDGLTGSDTVSVSVQPKPTPYSINTTIGPGGSIDPVGPVNVDSGGAYTFTIAPDLGHEIADVLIDDSSVGPVSSYEFANVTANHTIEARFSPLAYTVTASAQPGGSITPSGDLPVNHGQPLSFTLAPGAGYVIEDVLIDGVSQGPLTSYTFSSVTAHRSIQAVFTAIPSYTITTPVSGLGTIEPAGPLQVTAGDTIEFTFTPAPDYGLGAIRLDGSSLPLGNTYVLSSIIADHTLQVQFLPETVLNDKKPPKVTSAAPRRDDIQARRNTLISLHLVDEASGVDPNSVSIAVNGEPIYQGGSADYTSTTGICRRYGSPADYAYIYQANAPFNFDHEVRVDVSACDAAGNAMAPPCSYAFATEMHRFGSATEVTPPTIAAGQEAPRTVCDRAGALWVVWHAGLEGARNIYIAGKSPTADTFSPPVPLGSHVADQCHPVIAAANDGYLYVAWQDKRRGNWDIYISSSADGLTWSTPTSLAPTDTPPRRTNLPGTDRCRQHRLAGLAGQSGRQLGHLPSQLQRPFRHLRRDRHRHRPG